MPTNIRTNDIMLNNNLRAESVDTNLVIARAKLNTLKENKEFIEAHGGVYDIEELVTELGYLTETVLQARDVCPRFRKFFTSEEGQDALGLNKKGQTDTVYVATYNSRREWVLPFSKESDLVINTENYGSNILVAIKPSTLKDIEELFHLETHEAIQQIGKYSGTRGVPSWARLNILSGKTKKEPQVVTTKLAQVILEHIIKHGE